MEQSFKFKKSHPDAQILTPARGDVGWDLVATSVSFAPQNGLGPNMIVYGTGIHVAFPEGVFGILAPRSSICKYSLQLSNSVGILDTGYKGELKLVFRNFAQDFTNIYRVGDKIGQLIFFQSFGAKMVAQEVDKETFELDNLYERGENGFGSSGV
jgi:dUTP pyrophosphatase